MHSWKRGEGIYGGARRKRQQLMMEKEEKRKSEIERNWREDENHK